MDASVMETAHNPNLANFQSEATTGVECDVRLIVLKRNVTDRLS